MQLSPTLLPVPVAPAISRWGIVARSVDQTSPFTALPRARVRRPEARRNTSDSSDLAQVDRLPHLVRDLDPDVALAAHAVDADRLGLEGEGQVVGEPDDLRVLDAGVGLELVGGDDGPGVDLPHGAHARRTRRLAPAGSCPARRGGRCRGWRRPWSRRGSWSGGSVWLPRVSAEAGASAAPRRLRRTGCCRRERRWSSATAPAKGSAFWAGLAATRAACSGRSSSSAAAAGSVVRGVLGAGAPRRPCDAADARHAGAALARDWACLRITSRRIFSLRRALAVVRPRRAQGAQPLADALRGAADERREGELRGEDHRARRGRSPTTM